MESSKKTPTASDVYIVRAPSDKREGYLSLTPSPRKGAPFSVGKRVHTMDRETFNAAVKEAMKK